MQNQLSWFKEQFSNEPANSVEADPIVSIASVTGMLCVHGSVCMSFVCVFARLSVRLCVCARVCVCLFAPLSVRLCVSARVCVCVCSPLCV